MSSKSYDLGYQHGSADKLAGRPYDISRSKGNVDYVKGYRKGFKGTKRPEPAVSTGGGLSFSASASADFGTSPPSGTEGNADQGFDAPLPEAKAANPFFDKLQPVAPKPQISVAQRQVSTPFGAPAAPPSAPNTQVMPTQQIAPQPPPGGMTPMALSTTDKMMAWAKENWPYLAVGVAALGLGVTLYTVAKSHEQPKKTAA